MKLVSSSNFSRGDLYRTTDGGATWTKLAVPIGDPIAFADADNGWIAGGPSGDQMWATHDGGKTWESQQVEPTAAFQGSSAVYGLPEPSGAGKVVLPVSFSGAASGVTFYVTGDWGTTWTLDSEVKSLNDFEMGARLAVDISGPARLIAAPDGAKIYSEAAGSRDWAIKSPNGLPAGITDISFVNAALGWALAQSGECPAGLKVGCVFSGQLFKTADGGQTWELMPSGSQ